jgi:hypothetical protein
LWRARVHRQGGALWARSGSIGRLKHALLTVCAVGLAVVAAAGLTTFESDDYCIGASVEYRFTPPGWHCVSATGETTPPDTGNWAAFLAITAAGLVLLARRTKVAWATMVYLGVAGGGMFFLGGQAGLGMAFVFGSLLVLLVTRSAVALVVGLIAYFFAVLPWFFSDTAGAVGSTLVLLALALIPQRAEVMRERAVSL